jgi:Zn-dependent protease
MIGSIIMITYLVTITITFIVILAMSVTFHEVSHGLVAYVRGDRTAKDAGRLTLNPLKHIDLYGTIIFPALLFFITSGRVVFGMAKPVPVNFMNLRLPRIDMILVALAGPLANILFAQVLLAVYHVTGFDVVLRGVYLNLILAVFNLLPIPPLDGSRIAGALLPRPLDAAYFKLEPFGLLIVFALLFTGVLSTWVIPWIEWLANAMNVPSFPAS